MIKFLLAPIFTSYLRGARVFIGTYTHPEPDDLATDADLMTALALWGITNIIPHHTSYGFLLTNGDRALEISINSGTWTGSTYDQRKTLYFDFTTVQSLIDQLDWLIASHDQQ